MTTSVFRPKSKMAELGEVIRAIREDQRHSPRSVADFVGASVNLYKQWEDGDLVPDNQRWGRLCTMLRQLRPYRQLWIDASHELAQRDRAARPINSALADKLAGVIIAPTFAEPTPPPPPPAPAPTPEPAEEAEPVTDKKHPVFDVRNLPEGWRTAERVKEREDFAREMFRNDPAVGPIQVSLAQKEKFGVATDKGRLAAIRADELAKAQKAAKRKEPKLKAEPAAPTPKAPSTEESIAAATELLMETIPNLASFTLNVDANGQARVAYTTRVVVEHSGTITVGARK